MCLQGVGAGPQGLVTAFLLKNEPTSLFYVASLRSLLIESEGKPSLNRATSTGYKASRLPGCEGKLPQFENLLPYNRVEQRRGQNTKPGELTMARVNSANKRREARTHVLCKTRG